MLQLDDRTLGSICFSDESRVVLGHDNRLIWCRKGMDNPAAELQTIKFPPELMVFAVTGHGYKSRLLIMNASINEEDRETSEFHLRLGPRWQGIATLSRTEREATSSVDGMGFRESKSAGSSVIHNCNGQCEQKLASIIPGWQLSSAIGLEIRRNAQMNNNNTFTWSCPCGVLASPDNRADARLGSALWKPRPHKSLTPCAP
jgi:hypothetical protein